MTLIPTMQVFSAKLPDSIHALLSRVPPLSALDVVAAGAAVWVFIKLIGMSRRRVRTTKLRGPPNPSFVYGVGQVLMHSKDPASIYELWAREYGSVFAVSSTLGERRIVLYDPKALTHFYAKESWLYVRTPLAKKAIESSFGKGLFSADGESHRRQRKSLTPAFTVPAIRKLTPLFYDSAHKAKGAWNNLIESSGGDSAIIDVQTWANYISLDVIGIAGFSHDFGAVEGKYSVLTTAFDSFSSSPNVSGVHIALGLLAQVFPILLRVPTARTRLLWKLHTAMKEISNNLLARTKNELERGVVTEGEKSVIGLLIQGESAQSQSHLTSEEVLAQMKTLLVAGYETTSISVTWALIELSQHPDIQTKLRSELLEHGSDPTYDQLMNGLPYLDAVVHEVLRMHSPVRETTRMAAEDDVIPLSEPIRTSSGELVENLTVAKGTALIVPMASINLATTIWGEDAKVFRPSRWLGDDQKGIPAKAKELQGHRHLLTFSDGPRMCLGKNFAVAEFKAILFVLVKNFVFELRDGGETKIEIVRGFLPRPRIVGEAGCNVPLRVKPYMG